VIEIKVALPDGELLGVIEANHVSELKRAGVPLRGNTVFSGVEAGELTLSDIEGERTYTWLSKPAQRSKNPLSKRFRVNRIVTLGEVWYEVQEWKWYNPWWDTWTRVYPSGLVTPIKYESLYLAREAVRFYKRCEEPIQAVVDRL